MILCTDMYFYSSKVLRLIKMLANWARWHMPLIPSLERHRWISVSSGQPGLLRQFKAI